MDVVAAMMTGPGAGAIATIQLCGGTAQTVLAAVFRNRGGKPFEPAVGRVLVGAIVDGDEVVDEVTIGCEEQGVFALHCHGNPLLVQRILALLQRRGLVVVPAEQLLARILTSRQDLDAIAVEGRLALATVKTRAGAALLAHQAGDGLSDTVRRWRDRLEATPLEQIAAQVRTILNRSEPARRIIHGCTIALVGPPNTGKSTLLNTLAGREKAIVSDLRGTTRDWVSAQIQIPPLAATLIDTAGLDPAVTAPDGIDQAAQRVGLEVARRADLILLVLDASQPADPPVHELLAQLADRRIITVLNKADLPSRFDPADLPSLPRPTVRLSAGQGTGINDLIGAIHHVCQVANFDLHAPAAFTDRQIRLLESLLSCASKAHARSILDELLGSD